MRGKKMTFVDLFCGLGSFHLALRDYGKCVLACDIEEKIREVYKMNFGMDVFPDVTKITKKVLPGSVDIVCAGSPC